MKETQETAGVRAVIELEAAVEVLEQTGEVIIGNVLQANEETKRWAGITAMSYTEFLAENEGYQFRELVMRLRCGTKLLISVDEERAVKVRITLPTGTVELRPRTLAEEDLNRLLIAMGVTSGAVDSS